MTNEEKTQTTLNPVIVGEIDLPKIDLKPYNGCRSMIKIVEFHENSQYGVYAKVISLDLTIDGSEDKGVYATKILGLFPKKNDNGDLLGYGWGADTKTGLFMKKYGADSFDDLVGKKIVIIYEIRKDGKEFLTF